MMNLFKLYASKFDGAAKGGLTKSQELFTMILYMLKDSKHK